MDQIGELWGSSLVMPRDAMPVKASRSLRGASGPASLCCRCSKRAVITSDRPGVQGRPRVVASRASLLAVSVVKVQQNAMRQAWSTRTSRDVDVHEEMARYKEPKP